MQHSPRASLLLTVASRLPQLIEQSEELEGMLDRLRNEYSRSQTDEDVLRRVERWSTSAATGLEAAEKLIAAEPARSLAEAAVQLMLAVAKAQILSVSGLDEEEREAVSAELQRILHSVLPIVADAAGISLSDYGQTYYADRRTDPFYRGNDALAEPSMPTSAEAQDETQPALDPMARLKAAGYGA